MPATEIKDARQFDALLRDTPSDKLIVVDFHAVWCGPCKIISPHFVKLSNSILHATFVKVDVDKVQAIAQKYNVRAMPTFLFLKGGNKIDELKGADVAGLTEKVTRHAGPAPRTFASSSGSSSSALDGLTSLRPLFDSREILCLNESSSHPLKPLLSSSNSSSSNYLESDADEQLLLTVPFLQPTRLRSLVLHTSDEAKAQAPKRVKLFVNRPNLGFDEAEGEAPTQEFEISEGKVGEPLALRLVKFQGVQSLHIFIMSNQGDEETTRIDGIEVYGEAMDVTSRDPLKKVEE
ncbi:PITH domain-containing protein [Mrakia frigida]|uniref:thioredoxin-like protein 1 n=1 Tax=Mrakia frigida TaxID=29902 RepID=UPI003FCC0E02